MSRVRTSGILCLVVGTLILVPLAASDDSILMFREPTDQSEPVARVSDDQPIEILSLVDGWAEVRQGATRGWVVAEPILRKLPLRLQEETGSAGMPLHFSIRLTEDSAHRAPLAGLVDFVFGQEEQIRKMSDPFYRHAITGVASEWGRLFKFKTPYYSWRGVHLAEVWKDRLQLNLVKGRTNYGTSFGAPWSAQFQDRVLRSNRGILKSRSLFGRGKNLFIELRYSF